MPELITATLAISSPNPGSANALAGKPPTNGAAKATEGSNKDAATHAKESDSPASNSPFGEVLQRQMAKNSNAPENKEVDAQNTATAATATIPLDPNAAIFAALAGEFAITLPKLMPQDGAKTDTTSTDTTNVLPQLQAPETALLALAVPTAGALLPQNERPASEPGTARPLTAGLKEAPQFADGKIALDAAITAESSRRSGTDQGDTSFQVLLDARAQQAQAPATSASSQASSAPVLRIDTPVGQAGWHEEMGQKLTWIATSSRQQADLVLNPPNLGRVEVSLSINGDQANAVFASPNAAVRDLIESSLPRLREILADAGINLGQTHVGSESASQSSNNRNGEGSRGDRTMNDGSDPLALNDALGGSGNLGGLLRSTAGRGMVDVFA
jgi:flagellar hook-length control protein FliK